MSAESGLCRLVQRPTDPLVWLDAANDSTKSGGVSFRLGRHHVERLWIDRQSSCDEHARTVENMSMVGHEEVDDRQLKDRDIHSVGAHGPRDPVDGSFSLSNSPSIGLDGRVQPSTGALDAHGGKSRRWSSKGPLPTRCDGTPGLASVRQCHSTANGACVRRSRESRQCVRPDQGLQEVVEDHTR